MTRTTILALAATLTLGLTVPAPAAAQGKGKQAKAQSGAFLPSIPRGGERDEDDRRDRDERDDRAERGDGTIFGDAQGRQKQGKRGKQGKGPKFCRNGEGHPVHGRQWCAQKGFGLGSSVWRSTRWDDAVFRRTDTRGTLTRDVLSDVLGGVLVNRLATRAQNYGHTGALTGRWLGGYDGTRTLLVSAGAVPLAELVDRNADGRVDVVLVNARR